MFTKTTCLAVTVLAVCFGGSDACVGSFPNKCCMQGYCNVGQQGSTWPEAAACPGGLCKSNPLCPTYVEGMKTDWTPCGAPAAAAPAPAPAAAAPAPAPAATAPAPTRAPTAVDSNISCPMWAADGQCTSNPDYMLTSCALSCSSATVAPTTPAKVVNTCDQRNVVYGTMKNNCCDCERQAVSRQLRGRKLGLIGATASAATSVAGAAAETTAAANSAYNNQLACC